MLAVLIKCVFVFAREEGGGRDTASKETVNALIIITGPGWRAKRGGN